MSIATSPPGLADQSAEGLELDDRFALSARVTDGQVCSNADFDFWFAGQRTANAFKVMSIPFDQMRGWSFAPGTGDLVHQSDRFFRIEGLGITRDLGGRRRWSQPIINQPEIGLLGILVKEFDGVLHLLMQAKMEPGNIGTVQLSPTVQATRSNYLGAHGGRAVPYMEYFTHLPASRVVVDVLQSEHGSWFLRKRNRNMIVEAVGDVPDHPDFVWLTLGQVNRLMGFDHVLNMDARTVLSCVPGRPGASPPSLLGDMELMHWLTERRSRHELVQRTLPLNRIDGWYRDTNVIAHDSGRYFRVVAAEVIAAKREVPSWTQPLIDPGGQGVIAFLARRIFGVPHLLVQARSEAGSIDVAEIAPTVQYQPSNYAGLEEQLPAFADVVAQALPERFRFDTVQSEEGGRFMEAANRYQIIDVGDDFPLQTPANHAWVTPQQLMGLLQHGYNVNVQARSLLAGLMSVGRG
jgi:dTDP-4-dehydro-6-deoxy-alpha-D-glucopyranose 2,3-dehydratase